MKLAIESLPAPSEIYGVIQFSDSIIISRPFSNDCQEAGEFLKFVAAIQSSFLANGVLLRGGVAVGHHFQDDKILYSKGLIDAYRLESERADGPRVLVSRDLIDLIDPDQEADLQILIDEDGESFVDYLGECDLDTVAVLIEESLKNKSLSDRARRKWIWLGRYFSFTTERILEGMPSIQRR